MPDTAAPAPVPAASAIPHVASLSRKHSRKRVLIGLGTTVAVVGATAAVAGHYLSRSIAEAFPKRAAAPGPSPVAATDAVEPRFPAAPPPPPPVRKPPGLQTDYTVPAPKPLGDEMVPPIPLKDGAASNHGSGVAPRPRRDPRDGAMMVISSAATARDLAAAGVVRVADRPTGSFEAQSQALAQQRAAIQAQLDEAVEQARSAAQATGAALPPGVAPPPGGAPGAPFLPGVMPTTPGANTVANPLATATVRAERLPDRRLILPFGANAQCQLLARVATTAKGSFSCQVARDVYSMDGTTVLIDAGSFVEADYEAQNVGLGVNAIPVLRPRLRTPEGVVFDLPGEVTGALGEGGLPGHLDERWGKRLGPALLLSLVSDAAKVAVAKASNGASGNTIVIGGGTLQQGDRLATDVARRTLDIPAVFTVNQGATVFLHFKQNVDFRGVYALKPAN